MKKSICLAAVQESINMEEIEEELELDIQSGSHPVRDERKHRQLIDAISSLDGKKSHRLSQRTVLSNNISEFNFSSSKGGGVNLSELVGTLKETASHTSLKEQLRSVDKKKLLVSEPLPKHEKQKINRSVAYEKTSVDVTKWDPVVHKNREAEQLQFPLQKQDFRVITTTELVKRFQPRTPLEVQVAALLNGSENVIKHPNQTLTPAEQRALRAMDINDAKERRQELMKHRALLSYKEAKAKWQKKIKSKRYHRILKKDKVKQEQKQLGELAQTDPEEYLERLKLLEKDRVEERLTQKHRGGSKFGRRQMMYAKYDDRAREQVQEMIRKNKELTQKLEAHSDSEEVSEDEVGFLDNDGLDVEEDGGRAGKGSNPWMAKPSVAKLPTAFSQQEEEDMNEIDDDDESGEHSEDTDKVAESMALEDLGEDEDAGTGIVDEPSKSENVKSKKRKKTAKSENVMTSLKKSKLDESSKVKNSVDDIFERVENSKSRRMKKKEKDKKRKERKKRKENDEAELSSENETFEVDSKKKGDISSDEDDEERGEASLITESLSRKRTLDELENMSDADVEVSEEVDHRKTVVDVQKEVKKMKKKVKQMKTKAPTAAYVDPNKLFQLESRVTSVGSGPDIVANGDDDDDDIDPNEQQRMTIAQAFADDDVIEQFQEDKEDAVNKNKPKDIDLNLPGWGDWGGDGIKPKRKKRFIIKAPPTLPRRDHHLGNVIINEDKTAAARKLQVNSVPFPFKNIAQFEKSIRVPLGKTWNPEGTFKTLTKPKVVTHLGQVITPIDKSEVSKYQDKKMFKTGNSDTTNKDGERKPVFKQKSNVNKKHGKNKTGNTDSTNPGGEKKQVFKNKRNINKKHNKKRS